jgi:hypothetical protein
LQACLYAEDYASENDVYQIVRHGKMGGVADDQITSTINEVADEVERELGRPEVWCAILTLAKTLKVGRTEGRVAVATIAKAMNGRTS